MVQTGLERFIESGEWRGAKLGLVANPTSVDRQLGHLADYLAQDRRYQLRALFGPEHGIRGDAQDMISVGEATDSLTGLPVHSLYGEDEHSLRPAPGSLDGLDAVLFDIQDVGSRYYTYVWTLVHVMRACAEAGVAVVVLDRPNPIGGVAVEGGAIAREYHSFVGLCSVPNRHGLTAAEIATMVRDLERLDVQLHVYRAEGWRRDQHYPETGLPWVMPSPNMPTYDTALVYPGMCLIEGTELSEGRGTTRPFELFGAPFVDGHALARQLSTYLLPGVVFRPVVFRPTFQKHASTPCGGVQLHVTDRAAFRPYLTGVAALVAVRTLWPEQFQWRRRAYEFVADRPAIDLLAGDAALRVGIEQGASPAELAEQWAGAEAEFRRARTQWSLYE